jgi:hypothetical protein
MPGVYNIIPATVFRDGTPQALNDDQEALKRGIYEKMNPRRRKFVDRIGYENWDPFQKPNDPMDIRVDPTKRTTQQLINQFMVEVGKKNKGGQDYARGALECAMGVVNRDEKYLGIFDFCLWYYDLLQKEGVSPR